MYSFMSFHPFITAMGLSLKHLLENPAWWHVSTTCVTSEQKCEQKNRRGEERRGDERGRDGGREETKERKKSTFVRLRSLLHDQLRRCNTNTNAFLG